MADNRLLNVNQTRESPAMDLVPVVKSNTVNLDPPGRAIRCKPNGTAGALKILTSSGNERTTYIDKGEILPVETLRVFSTGTDADGLEVLI